MTTEEVRQMLINQIMELTDRQCSVALGAFKISSANSALTQEEAVALARNRLGIVL